MYEKFDKKVKKKDLCPCCERDLQDPAIKDKVYANLKHFFRATDEMIEEYRRDVPAIRSLITKITENKTSIQLIQSLKSQLSTGKVKMKEYENKMSDFTRSIESIFSTTGYFGAGSSKKSYVHLFMSKLRFRAIFSAKIPNSAPKL